MRYLLEVQNVDTGTEVVLKCLADDGGILKRSFVCSENEMIHFTVHDGQLVFMGHSVKPPSNFFGSGMGVISG